MARPMCKSRPNEKWKQPMFKRRPTYCLILTSETPDSSSQPFSLRLILKVSFGERLSALFSVIFYRYRCPFSPELHRNLLRKSFILEHLESGVRGPGLPLEAEKRQSLMAEVVQLIIKEESDTSRERISD